MCFISGSITRFINAFSNDVDLYQAKWTNEIHDEWIRNVLANRPDLKPTQLERTRNLMNSHVQDCLVFGYEH